VSNTNERAPGRAADAGAEPATLLVVEDDDLFRRSLVHTLEGLGHKVVAFASAGPALERLHSSPPTAVLTDLFLDGADEMDGMQLISRIREVSPDLPVILMTAHGNIPLAIKAIRLGAYDFLEKPFERDQLITTLDRAIEQRRLTLENRQLRDRLAFASGLDRVLLGDSGAMRNLRDVILRIAPTPANVIILGDTGAGKDVVARCLHQFSNRSGNFVAINCGAIPETLFESELFGHEAGAYTGANKQRVGKVEHASGGTLFLDEIEAMPMHLQAKLLRVIQERQVERLGSNKLISVDLRVVVASKVHLKDLSAQDKFRSDLYYRLNVANVRIPPLRERREDIPLLFAHFVQEAALRFGQPPANITQDVQRKLLAYDWPGNVRELRNAAEQLQLGIMPGNDSEGSASTPQSLDEILSSVEKAVIIETLLRHGGAANSACGELKINYSTLYRKMKSHGLDLANYREPAKGSAER
jgi:two-component system C4-dicarboxylate transport response regulator DctD